MSLDFSLRKVREVEIFDYNVTHNLGKMASEAGIYEVMWHPDEHGYTQAGQIIPILEVGVAKLKSSPEFFKTFNPDNGWGSYEGLVKAAESILEACKSDPDALIHACR